MLIAFFNVSIFAHASDAKKPLSIDSTPAEWRSFVQNPEGVLNYVDLSYYKNAKEIVFVDFFPNIGDAIIFSWPHIQAFRRLFPDKSIRVISPSNSVLAPNSEKFSTDKIQIIPPTERLTQGKILDFIAEVANQVPNGSAVVANFNYPFEKLFEHPKDTLGGRPIGGNNFYYTLKSYLLQSEEEFRRNLNNRMIPYMIFDAYSEGPAYFGAPTARFRIETNVWNKKLFSDQHESVRHEISVEPLPVVIANKKDAKPLNDVEVVRIWPQGRAEDKGADRVSAMTLDWRVSKEKLPTKMYDRAALEHAFLYGSGSEPEWDPKDYRDSQENVEKGREFLSQHLTSPEQHFAVVNINTKGKPKLEPLKKNYSALVKGIVAEIRKKHPEMSVFITEPEAQFGDEVRRNFYDTIEELTKKGAHVVLLKDADKKFWKTVIHMSSLVITTDSGLAHLANVLAPRVVIFSLNGENYYSGAIDWASKKNPAFSLSDKKPLEELFHWISDNIKLLPRNDDRLVKLGSLSSCESIYAPRP